MLRVSVSQLFQFSLKRLQVMAFAFALVFLLGGERLGERIVMFLRRVGKQRSPTENSWARLQLLLAKFEQQFRRSQFAQPETDLLRLGTASARQIIVLQPA